MIQVAVEFRIHKGMETEFEGLLQRMQERVKGFAGYLGEVLARARSVGYSDGEITEIVATVALTTFTNFFNRLAQTEIDFPLVKLPNKEAA